MASAEGSAPVAIRFGLAHMVVGRNLVIYRHEWSVVAFGVLEPVLYLLSIGVGVGRMTGHLSGLGPAGVTYPQYIAPALMAMAAMNGATSVTVQGVFTRLRFENTYHVMLATPVTAADIAVGEIATAALRGGVEGTGFLAITAALGMVRTPWALLAVPAAVLVGGAFASLGLLTATYLRDWQDLQAVQLVMLPMFLFATTFYPITVYPGPVQALVRCLPLYHAIDLLRSTFLGTGGPATLIPIAYLLVAGAVGLVLAVPRLERKLAR
jgi:lipooligosaccharide transport system permease protein